MEGLDQRPSSPSHGTSALSSSAKLSQPRTAPLRSGSNDTQGTAKSTPRRQSSSQAQQVTSFNSSASHSSATTAQGDLETLVSNELFGACFETDSLPIITREILVEQVPGAMDCIAELSRLPPRAKESSVYPAIQALLNKVLDGAALHSPSQPFHRDNKFIVYDKEMCDSVEGAAALKPDLLLLDYSHPGHDKARWRSVLIPVEVKADWGDLCSQIATYARAMFDSRKSRFCAPAIGINHAKKSVRFFLFQRGGSLQSKELSLSNNDSGRVFVRYLDGLLHWTTPEEAGFYRPALCHPFTSARMLSTRTCIRGRANCVAVLSSQGPPEGDTQVGGRGAQEAGLSPRNAIRRSERLRDRGINSERQPLRKERKPASALPIASFVNVNAGPRDATALEAIEPIGLVSRVERMALEDKRAHSEPVPNSERRSVTASLGRPKVTTTSKEDLEDMTALFDLNEIKTPNGGTPQGPPPTTLVVKQAWPMQGRGLELEMFQTTSGRFGLPTLWGFQILGDNRKYFPSDRKPSYILGKFEESPTPEIRQHIRMYFESMGTPFREIKTPKEAILAILHAMAGHFILLTELNVLHRDVSDGNILGVNEARVLNSADQEVLQRLGMTASPEMYMRGMLIDGDLSVKIEEQRPPSAGRTMSGTLPYMSEYLLGRWSNELPAIHTPVDDLESFVWVHILNAMRHNPDLLAAGLDRKLSLITSSYIDDVISGKSQLRKVLTGATLVPSHPLYGLVREWFDILAPFEHWEQRARRPLLDDEYLQAYKEMMGVGCGWLGSHGEALSEEWPAFWEKHPYSFV